MKIQTEVYVRKNDILKITCVGGLAALGFSPFNAFFVTLIAFGWLFVTLRKAYSVKDASITIFVFAFAFHIVSLFWIAHPLLINPARHAWLIPLALTLIPGCLSMCWIPVSACCKCRGTVYESLLIFSSVLSLIMYLYGHYCPGFPWVFIGYIWSFSDTMLQILSVVGIYGLNFITLLLSCLLGSMYIFWREKDRVNLIISVACFVGITSFMLVFGVWRLSTPTKYTSRSVRIVQGNIAQEDKMNRQNAIKNLRRYLDISRHDKHIDIIIWPEASIPYLYREDSDNLHILLRSVLNFDEVLVAGAVREDMISGKIYNSVVCIDCYGRNFANYDKVRLVPFGEYVPFRNEFIGKGLASEIDDFDRGPGAKTVDIHGLKVAFAICYEAVFPHDILPDNDRVDVIINLTNDAWFGYTTEPFQHLQIVRARAVEYGIPLIRVTNFGISTVYDAFGREIGRIAINTAGFLDFDIPACESITPYSRWGDVIFFILIFAECITVVCRRHCIN